MTMRNYRYGSGWGDVPLAAQRVEADGFVPHAFDPQLRLTQQPPCPRIIILPQAYDEMRYIVRHSPLEVGWLGCVSEHLPNVYTIERVFIHEQRVHETRTELSESALCKFGSEMLMLPNDEGDAILAKLRFWGHSHVFMDTVPSPQDDDTMEMIRTTSKVPWYLRGIFNKVGRASFSLYRFDRGYTVHDVPWQTLKPEAPEVEKRVERELGKRVKRAGFMNDVLAPWSGNGGGEHG